MSEDSSTQKAMELDKMSNGSTEIIENNQDVEGDIEESQKEDLNENTSNERGGWDSKADFIMVCIGYAVGLGNIWRFPYMVYKNGGGAFLIPYFLCLVFLGIPMFYLEIGLGQYLQLGGISVWQIVPCFKGVGYASASVACIMNVYYIVIIAWILVYLFFSFFPTLPWTVCDAYWNDIYCYDYTYHNTTNNATQFCTGEYNNITINMTDSESPSEQFWNNFVLQMSDGIHDIGSLVWYLVVALTVAWLLTYACIVKGVKTTGKIVWFTTTFPYVIITILLIRSATLPGADEGIYYYIVPDWEKLLDPQVWVDAASQIFFSLGVGISSLISLGSYNKYSNNIVIDSLVVCFVNCGTSFYAGFMVFATLGFMAHEQNVEVSEVVDSGPGLTFITVPTAIAEMPGAQFWSILFFFMLLLLGLDSQFCVVEGFYTCLCDEYPKYLRKHRPLCLAILCVIYFFVALPCLTNAGIYFFELLNVYGAGGYVLLWVALWECITICYVYGIKKFMRGMHHMLQKKPSYFWPISWCLSIPVILILIQLFSFVSYSGAMYGEDYHYPVWGEVLGWLMAVFSMHWVVTYFIYSIIVTPGNMKQRWYTATHPRPHLVIHGLNGSKEDVEGSLPPTNENVVIDESTDL
ncbi:sodium- and chloride-dependent GABA transporter 1-like [Saccoglossus kowalevskii]|uniref:Transporter n=1 Tax=Saccoglossus kowalevskii TaxID=10224 RepID=A0ABM0H0L2_SACKO|nr:PREDICTED: sodium- and chloride-dependent creatine transporter 1-like [Saccoglossus kowalevskii]